jgi:hypothetical protein
VPPLKANSGGMAAAIALPPAAFIDANCKSG